MPGLNALASAVATAPRPSAAMLATLTFPAQQDLVHAPFYADLGTLLEHAFARLPAAPARRDVLVVDAFPGHLAVLAQRRQRLTALLLGPRLRVGRVLFGDQVPRRGILFLF